MPAPGRPAYRRIVLKLSGEALAGSQGYGIDPAILAARSLRGDRRGRPSSGVQIAIVIGGGNIFRGIAASAGRHGARHRRLHGHARHRHQRARAAGRAREGGRADPRAVGHRDARGRRALHPPPRHPPPREGPRRRSSRPAPAIRSSRPTPRPPCARWRSAPRRSSRPPRSTASTPPIPPRTRRATKLDRVGVHRGAQPRARGDGHHRHLALHGEQAARSSSSTSPARATSGGSSCGEPVGSMVVSSA